MRSVREWLYDTHHCSESLLEQLAIEALNNMESNYWYRARDFVRAVEGTQIARLSFSEYNWLEKIRDGLLLEAQK